MHNSTGAFILNNPSPVNDYTGGTFLTAAGTNTTLTVAFWNSTPFGPGPLTISNSATASNSIGLTSHNTLTLANPISLASFLSFRNWDAPLTLSGGITLTAASIIRANFAWTALPAPNNEGSFQLPGPLTRHPTIITGNIGEASAGLGLAVNGAGVLILQPTTGNNTYTGVTTVR